MRPAGGGTAFVRVSRGSGGQQRKQQPVNDADFSARLALERGVSVVPGGFCFSEGGGDEQEEEEEEDGGDFRGYVRLALGEEETIRVALPILEEFVVRGYYYMC